MSAASPILRRQEGGRVAFWCPGCDGLHSIRVEGGGHPVWSWNGDAYRPTFQPSVLVSWDQWVPPADTPEMIDKIKRGDVVQHQERRICHSFVTDGRIRFLGDCTHHLAGQTVDLPPWEDAP